MSFMLNPYRFGSGGSPGAHRYWRIFVTSENGEFEYVGLAELEMRETASGADVTSAAFAIVSTEFGGAFVKESAFDDSTATSWASVDALPQWIGQDFGAGNEKDIVEVVLTSRGEIQDAADQAPNDFWVQYSDDGTNWHTRWSVSDQSAWGLAEARTFTKP